MPRKAPRCDKPFMYWWTRESTKLRKENIMPHAGEDVWTTIIEYRSAKRRFCSATNKNEVRCWQYLVNEVNENLWGLRYKLVTRKIDFFAETGRTDKRHYIGFIPNTTCISWWQQRKRCGEMSTFHYEKNGRGSSFQEEIKDARIQWYPSEGL